MECQDVKQLLAFVARKCEGMDDPEREAIQQHLDACPACAELAQTDRSFDDAVGQSMRDVAVPADFKQKLLKQLAAEPRRLPWKRVLAAAAVVLIVASGSLTWRLWPLPAASVDSLVSRVERTGWDEEKLEAYFAKQGISARVPRDFNYRYLHEADVGEFEGQRVARLVFSRTDQRAAVATVLILSSKQFKKNELWQAKEIPATTWIRIRPDDEHREFTYLIFHRGEFEALLHELN